MSYDILFVPRRPGQSWDDALDEAEGRDVLGDAIRPERMAQWERVVEALRRRLGEVDVTVGDDVCEASHASGLQVSLFPDEAAVTFPYRDREDRRAFHDTVVDVVGIVERETGLQAWDAQTDEPFDGLVHDETGLAATRRIGQETSDVATTDAMADRAAAGDLGPDTGPVDLRSVPLDGPDDGTDAPDGTTGGTTGGATTGGGSGAAAGPGTGTGSPAGAGTAAGAAGDVELALQRRRALRYVAIGVVVVVAALLIGARGRSSSLSTLALVVGAADIVIGVLLYRAWARRARSSGAGR